MSHRTLQPDGWARPRGYANGIVARGRTIFLAGQIGWDAEQRFVGRDLVTQAKQALQNIVAILAEDGAKPEHIVRLTWYVTDRAAYLAAGAALGAAYRDVMGKHFPAMTAVEVSSLMEADAVVEIEATAVVPE
ncbi:RidA family protein [Pseudogemmatithrix spongiicola]|uniref:RidA family protein n=1 Tax=Pseudogemmatithrix spongiicola TaxID=3062599 RepID=A0AA49Q8V8_9BACT|nr:RidA family protein [Gemmatimonadaceae bacterium 'strain 138']WKW16181.1 RidA family protein [Gemmatimonadaceae bacterium 'strain 318']